MNIINKVINIITRMYKSKLIYFADKFYEKTETLSYQNIQKYAIKRIIQTLDVESYNIEKNNRKDLVALRVNKFIYLGPVDPDQYTCKRSQIIAYKNIANKLVCKNVSKLSNAQIALLHNVIYRVITEFSGYPYLTIRTQSLGLGDVFIDVGAFRGYVSMQASSKVGTIGNVISVEPIKSNYDLILHQKKINSIKNILILNGAVSTEDDEKLDFYKTNNQVNSLVKENIGEHYETISVNNISTRHLLDQALPLYKKDSKLCFSISTNGDEMDIVRDIIKLVNMEKYKKLINIEFFIPIIYTGKNIDSFVRFLTQNSYDAEFIYPWMKIFIQNSDNLE